MKRLMTVTFFTGILTFFRMLAGFIVAKAVAVYSGPTGLVLLGQLQSVVACLLGLVNAPAGAGVVRYTAENIDTGIVSCSPWWRASVRWVCIIIAIVAPISVLLSNQIANYVFGNRDYAWIIILTAAGLPFAAAGTLINSIINGLQKYKIFVSLGLISTFFSTVIMVLLIFYNKLSGALIAVAIQNTIVGIVMLVYLINLKWFQWSLFWGRCEPQKIKDIRNYIIMAVTSALVVPISLIAVRNIIVSFVGWSDAGSWQATWRISETYLTLITVALSAYYLPRLSTIKDNREIFREINLTLRVVLPVTVVSAFSIFFLRDFIIALLFTGEFQRARDLIPVQLVGDILKITSWLYAYVMISRGLTRLFVFSEVFFGVSFVILVYVCVSQLGTVGASVAYVINYLVYFLFSFYVVKTSK